MPHEESVKRSDEDHRQSEMIRVKREIEAAEKIFYNELSSKYFLLDKFSADQLKDMCSNLRGRGPDIEYYEDRITKKVSELPQYKEDYIHFIIDEFSFSEIKQYALEKHIVTDRFFEK